MNADMTETPKPQATETSYQRLGGETVLRQLVPKFYEIMNEWPEARGIRKMHTADPIAKTESVFLHA